MFHELVGAFAGFVIIQMTIFIVGDALGLLGERFEKTKLIEDWLADMPETLIDYFFHSLKRHNKPHLPTKP